MYLLCSTGPQWEFPYFFAKIFFPPILIFFSDLMTADSWVEAETLALDLFWRDVA